MRQDIDRLARHVTGRAVGVALGGGGARGFAHIGVLRASVSIPGVMPPVAIGDELHVDGGVLDNLPVRAVRAYPGVGTVIAVDVAPHAGPRVTRDHGMHLSGWHLLRDRLLPGRTPPRVPGIMSTVLRSMLVAAERERSEVIDGGLADLFLQLQVPDLGLLDFDQVGPTAEAGYAQALPELERWLARSEQSHIVRAAVGLG